MDYGSALEFAAGRKRFLAGNTTVDRQLGNDVLGLCVAIRFHRTDVIEFYPCGSVALNSGGWHTVTTKRRLNQFTPAGISVFQNAFAWFVTTPAGTFDFFDGMVITPDGWVTDTHGADVERCNNLTATDRAIYAEIQEATEPRSTPRESAAKWDAILRSRR